MATPKFESNEPIAKVVEFLEKCNEEKIANQVLDVYAKYSTNIEQLNLLAKLYLDLRNNEKAEEYGLKVLSLITEPQGLYNARANLAKMYNSINKPEQSLKYSKINLIVTPNDVDTLLEQVFSYYLLNQKRESELILRQLKAREDTLSERHRNIIDFNLGTYDMESGEFLKGLAGFLINTKKLELWFSGRELPYQQWNGMIYPGRTLIMFMEGGGIGDDFITIRWYDNLKALGFRPIYYTSKQDIHDIFNRCGYETVMNLDNIPEDALWCYAMWTPLLLQVKPEQVLRENYLYPSDKAIAKWNDNFSSRKVLRIGIRWQGNSKNERDLHRRVPLVDIMNMLHSVFDDWTKYEIEYYSLQIGDGIEEIEKFSELIDFSNRINSFDDTFAFLKHLDFVVSSCTSVLHAAAIMGVKTYGLIPISAYFTWLSPPTFGRNPRTSIWYGDNLQIFRQVDLNNWNAPLNELKEVLEIEYVKS
jgi:tetratricopeptide (TPR) repeat protein